MQISNNLDGIRIKTAVLFPQISDSPIQLSPEARLEEACGLAAAINLDVDYAEIVRLRVIKPSLFLGGGYVDNLQKIIEERQIKLLIIDNALSPIQQRNLEKKLAIKVIDRTALILEIFGERAKTKEGCLQVELAHLSYQRSRLVRSWTHLERQRGGAGFLGGPGETQIELDRRIIDDKIVKIKKELEKVKKTRALQRTARQKIPYPVVAFVGYTNAGKSSWFNKLTNAGVLVKNQLFATLDPAMRRLKLPSGREVILSDTVGFISDLPHELVMAFRATLEEVLSADVIVHVRDIAGNNTIEQKKDVLAVLRSLGMNDIETKNNYIELLNKADLLDESVKQKMSSEAQRRGNSIVASALSGEGRMEFLRLIDQKLSCSNLTQRIIIPAEAGKVLAWLHANAQICDKIPEQNKIRLTIKISSAKWAQLQSWYPLSDVET